MGTSSFRGEQKAVTQQAHSLLPQWDKHNNRRDQCTQGQQRADKGFLKDQQAWFTIYIAQKRALLKKTLAESDRAKDQISIQLDSLSLVFTFSGHQIVALKPLFSQSDAACGMFKEQSGVCSPLSVEQTAFLINVNKRKIASSHICSNSFWHGCKFWTIITPMARILYLNVITAVITT